MGTSIWRRASENGEHGAPDRGQRRLGRPLADSFFPRSPRSQSLSREAAPLEQRGRASLFVDLAGHEMTLLAEMIVDLRVN
jgi:hypothetical protein